MKVMICLMLMFAGCADTYYSTGVRITDDGKEMAVPVKRFQKYSKTIGPGYVRISGNTIEHAWFDPSPNSPRAVITMTDPNTGVTTVQEIPVIASSDPSASTLAFGEAFNRSAHGVSNIAGTVFSGLALYETAKGVTEMGVAQINADKRTDIAATRAGVQGQRIGARAATNQSLIQAGPRTIRAFRAPR